MALLVSFLLLATSAVTAADPPPQTPRTDAGPATWTHGPFGYDAAGNITGVGTHYFIYDVNGRLTKASVDRPTPEGNVTLTQIHDFTYDEFGNMTSGPDVTTSLATDPATNHLTALGAVYDAAGNLVQWTPTGTPINYGYTYDALGALTEVRVNGDLKRLHVYTADDERLWTYDAATETSHWTLRDLGAKVLRDYFVQGTTWSVARDYVYRDGQLLATITPAGTLHMSLDHLGSPRIVTDASAMRVGFHHYFPFGKEWIISGDSDDGQVMKFTGHERDRDPAGSTYDVDYMHARYYSMTLGRFLAPDPLMLVNLTRPGMFNRHAYVMSSPVSYIDPMGLIPRCTFDGAGRPICYEQYDVIGTIPGAGSAATERDQRFAERHRQPPEREKPKVPDDEGVSRIWVNCVEHTFAPIVVGNAAILSGTVTVGAGAVLTLAGVGFAAPTYGTSLIFVPAGAVTVAGGGYLVILGVTVNTNHANNLFGWHLPSLSDRHPNYFPQYPPGHSADSGHSDPSPCVSSLLGQ